MEMRQRSSARSNGESPVKVVAKQPKHVGGSPKVAGGKAGGGDRRLLLSLVILYSVLVRPCGPRHAVLL